MAKYIDAELLKEAIERRKDYISVTHFAEELLSFIDSLQQEQPSEELEEEIKTWIPAHIVGGDEAPQKELKNAVIQWAEIVARHFAEWGAEHLKK